jgi:hypothetical protein
VLLDEIPDIRLVVHDEDAVLSVIDLIAAEHSHFAVLVNYVVHGQSASLLFQEQRT